MMSNLIKNRYLEGNFNVNPKLLLDLYWLVSFCMGLSDIGGRIIEAGDPMDDGYYDDNGTGDWKMMIK